VLRVVVLRHAMNRLIERRRGERRAEENPAPEYLAMLEVCGGEIRAGDRAMLAERRRTGAIEGQDEAATDVAESAKDRRAGTR
jgi:predicted RNA-binding Zn ribbon-like protein